jgi:hypothetical protein
MRASGDSHFSRTNAQMAATIICLLAGFVLGVIFGAGLLFLYALTSIDLPLPARSEIPVQNKS